MPLVFVSVSDPIGSGFVADLARPGGNVTGFANLQPSMGGEWLEMFLEIAPRSERPALSIGHVAYASA
jgi:putative tryptophan/tyrosine transport system substrate-binding protein